MSEYGARVRINRLRHRGLIEGQQAALGDRGLGGADLAGVQHQSEQTREPESRQRNSPVGNRVEREVLPFLQVRSRWGGGTEPEPAGSGWAGSQIGLRAPRAHNRVQTASAVATQPTGGCGSRNGVTLHAALDAVPAGV